MRSTLVGIDSEYGLHIDGRGAEDQIEDSMALVRSYPGKCHFGWDYRYESPRADLRGFVLSRLQVDPIDAQFDMQRAPKSDGDVRSDRVLLNGARFYNDHGHPEYATPECRSFRELADQDAAGMFAVLDAARALGRETGQTIRLYKNNTDFHGASYGTHESYLVPRAVGFDRLFKVLTPVLVARQILTGAGKVGSESGAKATYQLSQRANFFVEPANAETLYRRPVFNTRDEPHADPEQWIRLHMICGDANMMPSNTARKVGLVQLAIALCEDGYEPDFVIPNPVHAFQAVSKDETHRFAIGLGGNRWTTAYEVLEGVFAAAEKRLDLDDDFRSLILECRGLADALSRGAVNEYRRSVDWAAKRYVLEQVMEAESLDWRSPSLPAYDLEYSNIDPNEGLYWALASMDEVDSQIDEVTLRMLLEEPLPGTRAFARGLAVKHFRESLLSACWRSLTFRVGDRPLEVELRPERAYLPSLAEISDVESFIRALQQP